MRLGGGGHRPAELVDAPEALLDCGKLLGELGRTGLRLGAPFQRGQATLHLRPRRVATRSRADHLGADQHDARPRVPRPDGSAPSRCRQSGARPSAPWPPPTWSRLPWRGLGRPRVGLARAGLAAGRLGRGTAAPGARRADAAPCGSAWPAAARLRPPRGRRCGRTRLRRPDAGAGGAGLLRRHLGRLQVDRGIGLLGARGAARSRSFLRDRLFCSSCETTSNACRPGRAPRRRPRARGQRLPMSRVPRNAADCAFLLNEEGKHFFQAGSGSGRRMGWARAATAPATAARASRQHT